LALEPERRLRVARHREVAGLAGLHGLAVPPVRDHRHLDAPGPRGFLGLDELAVEPRRVAADRDHGGKAELDVRLRRVEEEASLPKGWKRRRRTASGIPGPSSATSITTWSPLRRAERSMRPFPSPIAREALRIRLTSAWRSSVRSQRATASGESRRTIATRF